MNNFFQIPQPPQVIPPLLPGVTLQQAATPSIAAAPVAAATSSASSGIGSFLSGFGESLLNALPTLVSTGFGAFTQYQSYRASQDFASFLRKQTEFQLKAQDLEAREKAIALRKEAIKSASRARALFAARGIQGQGTAAKAIQESFKEAQEGIETTQIKSELKKAGLEFEGTTASIAARFEGINRLLNMSSVVQQGLTAAFPLSK